MKIAILALILTVAAHADWVTPHGKAYHTRRDCIALRTTRTPAEITHQEALKRGLRQCGICGRSKKGTK